MKKIFDFFGAQQFIKETIDTAIENSVSILQVPEYLIDEAVLEIEASSEQTGKVRAIAIDVRNYAKYSGATEMPPIDIIKYETLEESSHIKPAELANVHDSIIAEEIMLANFVRSIAFRNFYFIYGMDHENWGIWKHFLTTFKWFIESNHCDVHPNLLLMAPLGVSRVDLANVAGIDRLVRWENAVTSCDIGCYADELAGPARKIGEKFARTVTIELAGSNLKLLEQLLSYDIATQFNPVSRLVEEKDAIFSNGVVSWENGNVDYWSEEMRLATLQLVGLNLEGELSHRVWRAQMPIAMKLSDTIRRTLICKYQYHLNTLVSADKPFKTIGREKTDPNSLELTELLVLNKQSEKEITGFLTQEDYKLATAAKNLRVNAAHMAPVEHSDIVALLQLWANNPIQDFIPHAIGWNWPRMDNKIILTIGPSKSGKSTWANRQEGEVISFENIRKKVEKGAATMPESIIFIHLLSEFATKMTFGRDVIVDHDFLAAKLREYFIQNVPKDITIQYSIINRSLEDKLAGAKAGQKDKIAAEEEIFDSQMDLIVDFEKSANVEVSDRRMSRSQ